MRELAKVGGPMLFENLRGREVQLELPPIQLGLLLVDHPRPPPNFDLGRVQSAGGPTPTVAMLRRDWEFLFDQLRSTHAVAMYIERVSKLAPVLLGGEPSRYYQLADADEQAEPGPAPAVLGVATEPRSEPVLPVQPVDEHPNAHGLGVIRQIMEDVALSPMDGDQSELERIHVLNMLDMAPVVERMNLGDLLLNRLESMAGTGDDEVAWEFRMLVQHPPAPFLSFATCSRLDEGVRAGIHLWLRIRHTQYWGAVDGIDDAHHSVLVVLTPSLQRGPRIWDTTMVATRGDQELDDDDWQIARELFPNAFVDNG